MLFTSLFYGAGAWLLTAPMQALMPGCSSCPGSEKNLGQASQARSGVDRSRRPAGVWKPGDRNRTLPSQVAVCGEDREYWPMCPEGAQGGLATPEWALQPRSVNNIREVLTNELKEMPSLEPGPQAWSKLWQKYPGQWKALAKSFGEVSLALERASFEASQNGIVFPVPMETLQYQCLECTKWFASSRRIGHASDSSPRLPS